MKGKWTNKKVHSRSNYTNAKKELTMRELTVIKNTYGVMVKQRHYYNDDVFDSDDYVRCSKSWKDQSKRRWQYVR